MGIEIERKWVIHRDTFLATAPICGERITQGYIPTEGHTVVRVRLTQIIEAGILRDKVIKHGYLTIKGANDGITRAEFEYEIPESEATAMLGTLCDKVLDKTRYILNFAGHNFEIDVFHGENEGLCVAELELESEDEEVTIPAWFGFEVSEDPKYYNCNLIDKPYSTWGEETSELDSSALAMKSVTPKAKKKLRKDVMNELDEELTRRKKRKKQFHDVGLGNDEDFFEALDKEKWSEESKETVKTYPNPNEWVFPFPSNVMMFTGITLDSESFEYCGPSDVEIPVGTHCGAFGAIRKHDIHKGVDLYAPVGTPVIAVESGKIVDIRQFTGEALGFPWWNDTWAVSVEGATGVVVYGEILPMDDLVIGEHVNKAQLIGHVLHVLKTDKGRPMSMLHFALHNHGVLSNGRWAVGEPQPAGLMDPTNYLLRAKPFYTSYPKEDRMDVHIEKWRELHG